MIHAWGMVRIDDYLAIEKLTALTGDHPEYLGWVALDLHPFKRKRSDFFIFHCKNSSVLGVGRQNDEGGCFPWVTEIHRLSTSALPIRGMWNATHWRQGDTADTPPNRDRFVYSHHATDPAGGKLLNAFDLVRAYLFDDEDPKKSFNDMADFAARDEKVQALGLEERMERAGDDFAEADDEDDGEWKKRLVRQKKSTQLENSLFNIKLIMQNDPFLRHIVFNQLADGMEIRGEVPWEHPAKFWRDADDCVNFFMIVAPAFHALPTFAPVA